MTVFKWYTHVDMHVYFAGWYGKWLLLDVSIICLTLCTHLNKADIHYGSIPYHS